jgi:hypothetical protein
MVVVTDLQANDAGAVEHETAGDVVPRAVDVLIEVRRLLDQLAMRSVHDEVALRIELQPRRTNE